jgi:hypothetical protein
MIAGRTASAISTDDYLALYLSPSDVSYALKIQGIRIARTGLPLPNDGFVEDERQKDMWSL